MSNKTVDPDPSRQLMKDIGGGAKWSMRRSLEAGADVHQLGTDPERGTDPHRLWTPLGLAVVRRQWEIVQELLAHGANPDQYDGYGLVPLHFVGSMNRGFESSHKILDLLLKGGASIDLPVRPPSQNLAEGVPIVPVGSTPLLLNLSQAHRWLFAERLMEAGAHASFTDPDGKTGFHLMMEAGWNGKSDQTGTSAAPGLSERLVKGLLAAGVSPNARDHAGNTPLDIAPFINQVVVDVIRAGGTMSSASQERLSIAGSATLSVADLKAIEHVLDLLNARTDQGRNVAHTWAEAGSLALLNHWCGAGRPLQGLLHLRDTRGGTPLFAAVKGRSLQTVEWLLDQGVQADAVNLAGNNVLHVTLGACSASTLEKMMTLFIEHGVDPEQCNAKGVSALVQQGHARSAPWIRAWERRVLQATAEDVIVEPGRVNVRRRL